MPESLYVEHKGRVIVPDARFKYVMAITLDPRTNYQEGIVRCVISRSGDLAFKGNTDRSELYKISGDSLENFKITERLNIKNEKEILATLIEEGDDFIGLEDPDIWIDEKNDLMHVYFTIPIIPKNKDKKIKVHLGHAVGKDLDSLEMTTPVLLSNEKFRAKEVSIAPINTKGFRYNLFESRHTLTQVAIAEDMGGAWKYGEIVFDPKDHNLPWIASGASPGPLFSKDFINVGEGKLLGVVNGREVSEKIGEETKYGIFSVGLFIYDYENGKIEWVSPEPFIRDSEAKNITFASCFVETSKREGILYAHVDDSFVRAYTIKAELLKSILPVEFLR